MKDPEKKSRKELISEIKHCWKEQEEYVLKLLEAEAVFKAFLKTMTAINENMDYPFTQVLMKHKEAFAKIRKGKE